MGSCAVSKGEDFDLIDVDIALPEIEAVENDIVEIEIFTIDYIVQEDKDNNFETVQQDETLESMPVIPEEQLVSPIEGTYVIIGGGRYCTTQTEIMFHNFSLTNDDIRSLGYMTNLTSLSLTMGAQVGWVDLDFYNRHLYEWDIDMFITDISPLAELTNLTHLDLSGHFIVDISPLMELTNLTSLGMRGNLISDITPLAGLINLTNLNLEGNPISDISPLANLSNLEVLGLCGLVIDTTFSLEPLAYLTNLTFLSISSRGLNNSDMIALASLTNLETLDLFRNQISDIIPLAELASLRTLSLSRNRISDLSSFANLPNLELLNVENNQISDLTPLVGLTSLERAWLFGNPISDLTPLASLTNLRVLKLSDNQISDLSSLSDFNFSSEPFWGSEGVELIWWGVRESNH